VGKSNQAKRRAKKAAKRNKRAARKPPRQGAQSVLRELLPPWGRTPEAARAQLDMEVEVFEMLARVASLELSLSVPPRSSPERRRLVETRLDFYDLLDLPGLAHDVIDGYLVMGQACLPREVLEVREKGRRGALSERLRGLLPAAGSQDGWLGIWTVHKTRGSQPPSYVDWLASARPSRSGEPTPAWRGARAPRTEWPAAEPGTFAPRRIQELTGRRTKTRHFIGWRVRRGEASVFFELMPLLDSQLPHVVEAVLDAAELGRMGSAADWDAFLLLTTMAVAGGWEEPGEIAGWTDASVVQAVWEGWRSVAATPLSSTDALAAMARTELLWDHLDVTDPEEAYYVRMLARELFRLGAQGRLPKEPGAYNRVQNAVRLLPMRLARVSGETDEERSRVEEEVLDRVREAFRLAFYPYAEAERTFWRSALSRDVFPFPLSLPPTGPLVTFDEEAFRARPLAWLGLPSDHSAARALGPHATIGGALRWAERVEAEPARSDVLPEERAADLAALREAVDTARAERRLSTLLGPPPRDPDGLLSPSIRQWFHWLSLGWRAVFDPRAGAASVEALPLPKRYHKRIVNALARATHGPDQPTLVRDLPGNFTELSNIQGLGDRLQEVLVVALWEHAMSWRAALVPREAARAVARASTPERQEARANLAGGLDALAALFGGDEDAGDETVTHDGRE